MSKSPARSKGLPTKADSSHDTTSKKNPRDSCSRWRCRCRCRGCHISVIQRDCCCRRDTQMLQEKRMYLQTRQLPEAHSKTAQPVRVVQRAETDELIRPTIVHQGRDQPEKTSIINTTTKPAWFDFTSHLLERSAVRDTSNENTKQLTLVTRPRMSVFTDLYDCISMQRLEPMKPSCAYSSPKDRYLARHRARVCVCV